MTETAVTTGPCRQSLECGRATETETETDEIDRPRPGEKATGWMSTIRISEHGWIFLERAGLRDREKTKNERDDGTMLHRISPPDSILTWTEKTTRIWRHGSSLEMRETRADVEEEEADDGPMSCLANNCILRETGKGMVIIKLLKLGQNENVGSVHTVLWLCILM